MQSSLDYPPPLGVMKMLADSEGGRKNRVILNKKYSEL